MQIIQIDQDLRSEVATELRETQGKISEFVERKVAAEDQLKRIDLRSPQDGVVHQLAVHTIGGVITPGEQVMQIVPVTDDLTVEAHVAPQDIDQVTIGQHAILRLSAFNQQTTPELTGTLSRISADLTTDERTGASLLYCAGEAAENRGRQAARAGAGARHARRSVLPDGRPDDAFLSGETAVGSDPESFPGRLKPTPLRASGELRQLNSVTLLSPHRR